MKPLGLLLWAVSVAALWTLARYPVVAQGWGRLYLAAVFWCGLCLGALMAGGVDPHRADPVTETP